VVMMPESTIMHPERLREMITWLGFQKPSLAVQLMGSAIHPHYMMKEIEFETTKELEIENPAWTRLLCGADEASPSEDTASPTAVDLEASRKINDDVRKILTKKVRGITEAVLEALAQVNGCLYSEIGVTCGDMVASTIQRRSSSIVPVSYSAMFSSNPEIDSEESKDMLRELYNNSVLFSHDSARNQENKEHRVDASHLAVDEEDVWTTDGGENPENLHCHGHDPEGFLTNAEGHRLGETQKEGQWCSPDADVIFVFTKHSRRITGAVEGGQFPPEPSAVDPSTVDRILGIRDIKTDPPRKNEKKRLPHEMHKIGMRLDTFSSPGVVVMNCRSKLQKKIVMEVFKKASPCLIIKHTGGLANYLA